MLNIIDFEKQPGKELKVINFEENYEPLISVIIPFYNDNKYIRQAVYSILNQTFPCFEILITGLTPISILVAAASILPSLSSIPT